MAPIGATGVDVFRSLSDDFVDANPDAVKEHMEREGLTRAETKELPISPCWFTNRTTGGGRIADRAPDGGRSAAPSVEPNAAA